MSTGLPYDASQFSELAIQALSSSTSPSNRAELLQRLVGLTLSPSEEVETITRLLKALALRGRQLFSHPELWEYFEAQGLLTDLALAETGDPETLALLLTKYEGEEQMPPRLVMALVIYAPEENEEACFYGLGDLVRLVVYLRGLDGEEVDEMVDLLRKRVKALESKVTREILRALGGW